MLNELTVKDFAIIQEISLPFHQGFNILSGETGAGKSVLLKSLSLLMGGKASSDIVRTGAKQAIIEGFFDLSDRPDIKDKLVAMGIDAEEDSLIVRRVIAVNGKSKVYLNGRLSTLSNLIQVVQPLIQLTGQTAPLIEITGQHESKNLLERAYHLEILDVFAKLMPERVIFEELFVQWNQKKKLLSELRENAQIAEQKLDFLQFQKKEIESLDLEIGEEESLENKYRSIKNKQKLIEFSQRTLQILEEDDDSALSRMQKALQILESNEKYDSQIESLKPQLEQAIDLSSEFIYSLQSYASGLDSEDEDLIDVEDRLSRFRKLQKKYGETSEDILTYLSDIRSQIDELQNSEQNIDILEKEIKELHLSLKGLAAKLHDKRKKAAKAFAKQVNEELLDLNMKGLSFLVELAEKEDFDKKGYSQVEFLCKTAEGDNARALNKTASGGELSRILLSMKKVMGSSELPRTYLFDEVDTGVSGETAAKVGSKLREIAKGQQVICVTHLPQVAALGEHHFFIEKSTEKKQAKMQVKELAKDERVNEIARLISGEKLSKTSLSHAKELLRH
jgi:DNA repair protein RecN (Recombination protein N)